MNTLLTIDLTSYGKYAKIVRATNEALREAIKLATPEQEVRVIGKKVQEVITSYGFSPIRNLSGHEIKPYQVHAGLAIPNYDSGNSAKLKEDMVIAIEPFATTGEGVVQDGKPGGDYKINEKKAVRDRNAREVLDYIDKTYKSLPFASRWIHKKFGLGGLLALQFLEQQGVVHHYKELVEVSKKPTTHFEDTVIVGKKPRVITKLL